MIRILHTIDTTGPGGAETVFVHLAKGLDPQQFRSFVAITGPGWVCDELRKNGIEPIFVQSLGGYNLKYLIELIKIIRENNIDIVQSHLLGANVYSSLAGLICRVPVVSTFHGFVDSSGKDRLMPVKSRIINQGSRKIVFVSDRLREHFIRKYGFSVAKSVTIYNGVDTSVFQPERDDSIRKELGLRPEHILIGAVGNIRPAKGYEYFLTAARLVIEKHPECRFVIAGEGTGGIYDALLSLRKRLGLEKDFFFLGFRENAAKVFNNLDIFVLSSLSEGFSISTIEAMACGLPVVVTRSGGPEEIVENEISGIIVEPGNERSLADGILNLLENKQLMTICLQGTKEFIKKKQSNVMFDSYLDLYNKCNIIYNRY
jgi:glycosyltransferase involved in cell wall biosynthesis